MASVILGATSLAQLETDLGAGDVTLTDAARAGIAAIHRRHPIPM
jgi:aryl-alcohol dehydrogenase-like predicted oxidoreductase